MLFRALPLVGLVLFIMICFVWRGWLQYRRYGTTGIVLFQSSERWRNWRDLLFIGLFMAVFLQAIVNLLAPQMLLPVAIAHLPALTPWFGVGVFVVGLVLTVAAQLGMGVSWRVGIDVEAAPGLVTGGLYQLCRNPIYLGMFVTLIGLTLMLATWISLALTVVVILVTREQTLQEEKYLRRTYGNAYARYAARVGRFVPGLGKLSQAA
jgi:protein-S-isoprenylcysteine O-methyltransferase Ste14